MRPTTRRHILVAIIVLAMGVSALTARTPVSNPTAFRDLTLGDLGIPLIGAIALLVTLIRRPARAAAVFGIGLYAMALAWACSLLQMRWFPGVEMGVGLVVLSILLFLLSVPLLIGSAFLLVRWRQGRAALAALGDTAVALTVTIGVLVLRGAGDWAEETNSASLYGFPVIVMAAAFCLIILDRADAWSHRAAHVNPSPLVSRRNP